MPRFIRSDFAEAHIVLRWPSIGLFLITAIAVAAFFGLAILGWGSFDGLLSHPARAAGLIVIAFAACASLFSGIHLGGCIKAKSHGQWRLIPLALISLALAWWPPYGDSRDRATLDGDGCRMLGLGCLILGAVLRVGPMFLLGERFTWPLAEQKEHPLITTGLYRLIRHPSYSGAMIGGVGWALLLRSEPGLLLVAMLFPFFLPVIHAEERLLLNEFGEAYRSYQSRTWRLIPFLY